MVRSILALCAVLITASAANAGSSDGVTCDTEVVSARSVDVYYERFEGARAAIVGISGDGDTDLDLYIYDLAGNLVASSDGWSDDEVASWVPSYTQTYKIRVVNRGYLSNLYAICVN